MKENKEKQLVEFIAQFMEQRGYAPSVREMQEKMNFASTSTVAYYLDRCEEKGLIKRTKGKNRALEVAEEFKGGNSIPLVGKVAAGEPILAIENIEDYIDLPARLFDNADGKLFLLTISGNSMINAGINNGDTIVVRQQNTAENGEIVVALLDDSATCKRFFAEKGHYRLQPENDTMRPIIVDDVTILGLVVGLIRKY